MNIALSQVSFLPPHLGDAQQTLEFMLRCNIHEYSLPDSDMDDLLYDWEHIDLNQDAWLAWVPIEELVGYAIVSKSGKNIRYELYADPEWNDDSLAEALLQLCEVRGAFLRAEIKLPPSAMAQIYIPSVNERNRRVVEDAGFSVNKFVFNMQADLQLDLPAPEWPSDVTLKPLDPDTDGAAIHQLIQAAFHRPGRTPQSFDDWKSFMMRADIFKPELWFLAYSGDDLAGACLCYAYTNEGWVRQLAVDEPWRGKGLGSALLRHSFSVFRAKGFERVGLAVEEDNPNAYAFYQNVGMQRIRQYHEYLKPLQP
jgi:mycothiol synthase